MAATPRLFLFLFFFLFATVVTAAQNVTYDARSLIIDGERKLIISGSIHYPRSVPSMWPGLVAEAKEGGLNAIDTYVFWNGHEPSPEMLYYFEDRFDLVKFAKIVRDAGLYMILRIGPFIAAEWTYGGIPVWLHYVPGTVFRTNNEPFKRHMESFVTYIVNLMKREQLFASQGGHIILAQIGNEYGYSESYFGDEGKLYAMWAAHMALNQGTGVPWVMGQQDDAPDPVINTCNSFYCDQFTPNSPSKPKLWTENWPGWFHSFGEPDPNRPPEDIAFAVARFFEKGGCLQNYYVYHGGTHYGRTTGGPFITTSYDYNAPIDEYGLPRFPKWGHLRELHKSVKLCEHTLLYGESTFISAGPLQEIDVFEDQSGGCVAFLANVDAKEDKLITFRNITYSVPPWSVSILPDCKNVVFNTAMVQSQISVVEMVLEKLKVYSNPSLGSGPWQVYMEKVGLWDKPDFVLFGLEDHINITKDTTDYLWYTTSFYVDKSEEILGDGGSPILSVASLGHAFIAFINGELQGSSYGKYGYLPLNFQAPVTIKPGKNEIAILSMTIGMYNAGPRYEWEGAGLTSVNISGTGNGSLDLSAYSWEYKIGLEGEHYGIFNTNSNTDIKWIPKSEPPKNQSLIWYKVAVDPPEGNEPVALDMLSMGKGHVWMNGKSIGRYWLLASSISDNCTPHCNYTGTFEPDRCLTRCGQPTQRWYHIPRSFFKPSGNTLVIFEEKGGDPTRITFARRRETKICGFVSDDHPQVDLENWELVISKQNAVGATMRLKCPEGSSVSSIKFASFGNPTGTCNSYRRGSCHYPNSVSVTEKACLHKNNCSIAFKGESFTEDLCPGTAKALAVEAACN